MAISILLDTHIWLWMNGAPERLSEDAQRRLMDAENSLFLSAASVWELGIKEAAGKVTLPQSPDIYVRERMEQNQLVALPIRHEHALQAATLPPIHRDPFDRMLVAQAQTEGLQLMTADRLMASYDVDLIFARR